MNLNYKESFEVEMTNILITLIMALSIKITSSALSPEYYLITYADGQREQVVITKNDHICPTYCNVDHAHKVNICEGGCEHINESFIINKHTGKNNTFSFYCKGKEIMLFEQIKIKDTKSKKKKGNSIKLF